MLPKKSRITTKDFKGIKTRLVYRGAFFDVSTAPILVGNSISKFACIVAKKRIRRAVDRNTARRKVYTLIKTGVDTLKSPSLVFIYPTKNILQAPHAALIEEIRKAFATL